MRRSPYWLPDDVKPVDASFRNGLSWAPRCVISPYDLEQRLGELLHACCWRGAGTFAEAKVNRRENIARTRIFVSVVRDVLAMVEK